MEKTKNKFSLASIFGITLFVAVTAWWVVLKVTNPSDDFPRFLWGASYGAMALFGGIYGLVTAKSWGFLKSSLGRAIILLSLGLLFAEFGQLVFSHYNIFREVDVPYPSIADIGFFGNMVFYVLGGFALMNVLRVKTLVMQKPWKLILAMILPLGLLVLTYFLFLKGYDTTGVTRLQVMLDYGYPIGDVIYVSTAIISLLFVTGIMGGILRKPLFLLLFAFIMQYAADFNFLYQNYHLTWTNGGYGDYLYFVAYSVMVFALIKLSASFQGLGSHQPQASQVAEGAE